MPCFEEKLLKSEFEPDTGVKSVLRLVINLWHFSTAWYDSVRHGSLQHSTAQFGSVCVSTAV